MTEQEADFRALEQVVNWTEAEAQAAAERWAQEICDMYDPQEWPQGLEPGVGAFWPHLACLVAQFFKEAKVADEYLHGLGVGETTAEAAREPLAAYLGQDLRELRQYCRNLAAGLGPSQVFLHSLQHWAEMQTTAYRVDATRGTVIVRLGSVATLVRAVRGLWPVAMGKATLEQCARDVVTSRPAGLIELVGNPDQTCGRWFVKGGTGRKAKEYCGQCTDKARRAVRRRERKAQQATG